LQIGIKRVEGVRFRLGPTTALQVGDTLERCRRSGRFHTALDAECGIAHYLGLPRVCITPVCCHPGSVLTREPRSRFTAGFYANARFNSIMFPRRA